MMRWFKRGLLLLLVLFVVFATIAFFLENQTMVLLSFIGWETPSVPVAFFVLLAFSCGGVVGVLLGYMFGMRYRSRPPLSHKDIVQSR